MGDLPGLIQDLALILVVAAITTLLFKKLKQPLVLGYIIAGFLVGPNLALSPSIIDSENIETLAKLGVIFLLFSLGLEFSFKKLLRVGGSASITALIEIPVTTISGYFLGRWMGWSFMDSLFLGGMLASSSTTIIIRAFSELGVKTKQYAKVVFGILVFEDIVVVLLMVLLSTMAVSQEFQGAELFFTVAKLLFFLALWFLAGIFLLPTFLKRVKKLFDEEVLLILSIGLCLAMVVVATQVGFSAELGAFIMGSIFAETTSAEKVEHVIKPVKDLFGAVFFVSVGMMINPESIVENWIPVLLITALILFVKLSGVTLGALVSGQPLKQSVQVGMSMAQIGEFAFIVATLGLSLGVISEFLFPVAVGVSVITTFTTPYLIKSSEPVYNFLERILPQRWLRGLNKYSSSTQHIQAESSWKKVLSSYGNIVIPNAIILLAIILLAYNVWIPFLNENIENSSIRGLVGLISTLGISSPFLWAVMTKKPHDKAYKKLWLISKYNRGPLLVLEVVRNLLGVLVIGFWVNQFSSTLVAFLVTAPVVMVILFLFSKRIQRFYHRIEFRFLSNLNARERFSKEQEERKQKKMKSEFSPKSDLSPWDAHIIDLEVNPHADYIGQTLFELAWREKYGINIAYIKRGKKIIYAPGRNSRLLPFDHVGLIATDDEMLLFKPIFDAGEDLEDTEDNVEDIILQKIVIDEQNKLAGLSIRGSRIRERTNGLVVGIERDEERILNPDSDAVFLRGDVIWIVGDRERVQNLNNPMVVNPEVFE